MELDERLQQIRDRIRAACENAGRDPAEVMLLPVSKNHTADAVRELSYHNCRVFGENRVQEAEGKWPDLKARHPDVVLHLIGSLQSNKAEEAVALFDVIETVDRPKIARALAAAMEKAGRRLPVFLQVNTGEEPQKGGVVPGEVDALLACCRDDAGLDVRGLMCIPPIDEEPAMHFALVAELGKGCGLPWLSMGMSGDFETAIRFGATHVRVGTAVFGDRG